MPDTIFFKLSIPTISQLTELAQNAMMPCKDQIARLLDGSTLSHGLDRMNIGFLKRSFERDDVTGYYYTPSTSAIFFILAGCGITTFIYFSHVRPGFKLAADGKKISPNLANGNVINLQKTSKDIQPNANGIAKSSPRAKMKRDVFIHGLGGCLAQFNPLLTTLINIAPCFGVDLPGAGLSSFSPRGWSAYSIEALATLVALAIEQHRDVARGQEVILVAHSMGCSISALIASSESPVISQVRKHIIGLVAICPIAAPPPMDKVVVLKRLLKVPGFIFNLFRRWDRRGGPNSTSVNRLVGQEADIETRKLQLRFNEQSRTPVWRRMAWGALPHFNDSGEQVSGLPGQKIWTGLHFPLFFVGGDSDEVTKPVEVAKLLQYFNEHQNNELAGWNKNEYKVGELVRTLNDQQSVSAFIFPSPASHAVLYQRDIYRTLSGLIQDFLATSIDKRLDLGWQLQHLTTSGKWDVKNLAKWQAVRPVSEPICNTFFALKTLREVDEQHSPKPFAQEWQGRIYAIIDISHESPVYDPAQLERNGIQYFKLPTVSKIPPTMDEVRDFITLVDHLEEGISQLVTAQRPLIAVHCHYGFNRTGFFIVSYLIERKKISIQAALEEFERCRHPGIRHEHFINTLFVRYSLGLR
ncbi:hypothetical protein FQN57_005917 [Myotisia sp. PD_48]|nr:hypothetical protein FQN57_005917 [Myotisia sp. PD_48]